MTSPTDQNDALRQGRDLDRDMVRSPMPLSGECQSAESTSPSEAPEGASPAPRLIPWKPFPVDALPEPLKAFVVAEAKAINCDEVLVILPLLTALGAAIGNTRRMEVKPGWTQPPILWTAIVAESGDGKSPAMRAAVQFSWTEDKKANEENKTKREEHSLACQVYKKDIVNWTKDKGGSPPPLAPEAAPQIRFVLNEPTIEALAAILGANPRGVLLARDELAGWFGSMGQYKKGGAGSDMANWLELYDAGTLAVDRKSEGASVYVPCAATAIAGTIQPQVLSKTLTPDRVENGLAARFLFAMPPRRVKEWTDSCVSDECCEEMRRLFLRLFQLKPMPGEIEGEFGPAVVLPFTEEAQAVYVEFYNRHSREHIEHSGAVAAAASKLLAVPARLALVIQCVRAECDMSGTVASDVIDVESIRRALKITEWFKHETGRLYEFLKDTEEDTVQRKLLAFVENSGGQASLRDVHRFLGKSAPPADDIRTLLDRICQSGIAHWEKTTPGPQGGRPSDIFVLNPDDNTDKTSGSVGSVIGEVAETKRGEACNE